MDDLLTVNAADVEAATAEGLSAPLLSRLKLTRAKCAGMAEGLRSLAALPDPLGQVQYAKELSPGLDLYRVSCPIGVVGVILKAGRCAGADCLALPQKRQRRAAQGWA